MADQIVMGVPMHNFGIPSTLKLWIDQIVRAGATFAYVDQAPQGLLKNRKATILAASGGIYDVGTAMASFNFVEPYLRTIFGFIGISDLSFVNAGGTVVLRYGKQTREEFLRPPLETIRRQFQTA